MAKPEVWIEATPKGEVTITAKNVKGKGCKLLTKEFEDALGSTISSKPTKEYFETQKSAQRIKQS